MKKNIAIVTSCVITTLSLFCLYLLWRQFAFQNSELRNLRASLWRQQVSERQRQVEIVSLISGVDEDIYRRVIDLMIESANEVDQLRLQNNIWHGQEELAVSMESLRNLPKKSTQAMH